MKFWHFREKSEHRAADFGAALAQAYEALAGGAAGVDVAQTAAAEFSIGAWGRAFAVAEVSGIHIPASVLEQIGRSLALRGNFVADVTADPMTGLALLPASSWDIVGSADPSTWTYHATLSGPSMQHTVTRTSAEIIHARVNSLPESPWAGRSPLLSAGFSAKAGGEHRRAGQPRGARSGRTDVTHATTERSQPNRTQGRSRGIERRSRYGGGGRRERTQTDARGPTQRLDAAPFRADLYRAQRIAKGGRERRRGFEFWHTSGPFLGIGWESRSGGLATIRGCGASLGKNRIG